jgi:hypothetical protein
VSLSRRDVMKVATRLSSPKSRQFIAWYRCEKGNRPGGYGMIGSARRATLRTINQPEVGIRPCPTGRIPVWTPFQAINCLATIISPFGTTNRRPCPHFRSHIRVIKYWSVGVLRQVPIPSALQVEDAEGAGDNDPAHDLTEFVGVDAPPPITIH